MMWVVSETKPEFDFLGGIRHYTGSCPCILYLPFAVPYSVPGGEWHVGRGSLFPV